MNKKGDINLGMVIGIVILISSFLVVFIFYSRANLKEGVDEQVCYASVVTRSEALSLTKDLAAPALNCRTGYYCISKDGTCEIMNPSTTEIIKVENSDDVYREIAKKMVSCWDMYGAGKLNYVGEKISENIYCSICYQVGFDDSLTMFANKTIQQRELYRYLSRTNISGTDTTYLKYLLGFDNFTEMENKIYSEEGGFGNLTLGKQYFIMMGIYNNVAEWKIALIQGALYAGSFALLAATAGAATPVILLGTTLSLGVGGVGGYFSGVFMEGETGQRFLTPILVEPNSEQYRNLKCVSIETSA
jgi:hypothetical protein